MHDPEISYFELQAYTGATKHMGGFESTKELIQLCHIEEGMVVLDVGAGVGATACYLAREHGCRVVGVDLRASMIARAKERARRENVVDRVAFKVADARELPFPDAQFDVVLAESVTTFIQDKQFAVGEYARVTGPGGYVGLNEEIWLKTPPQRLVEYVQRTWSIESDVMTADGWAGLLQGAGLRDVVVKTHAAHARREATQLRRYRPGDMLRLLYRTVALYIRNPAFRAYMADLPRTPRDVFKYLGYAILVGRKPGGDYEP